MMPTHEQALALLLEIESLLDDGPNIRRRTDKVRALLANANDYLVESRSFMTGEPIQIAARDRGTCLDPGTERYWTA